MEIKSIIQNQEDCYLCGRGSQLQEHHVFYGSANRKNSDKHGMIAMLCQECHHVLHHGKNGHKAGLRLKKEFQSIFEMSHTREEFLKIFGRNYL